MKRRRIAAVAATLALALWLLGCGTARPLGEPVPLLTGVDACYAGGETGVRGQLLADAGWGTTFNGQPVMWPVGFSGVRDRGEVVVLNAEGDVVATTGRTYFIKRAPVYAPEPARLMARIGAYPASADCGYPLAD